MTKRNYVLSMACLVALSAQSVSASESRIGRYTSSLNTVTQAQKDPMSVEVEVRFPTSVETVGQAIDYLLMPSGYSLAKNSEAKEYLLDLPLPSVHREIGPVKLSDALQVVAGDVWTTHFDPLKRDVHYRVKSHYRERLNQKDEPQKKTSSVQTEKPSSDCQLVSVDAGPETSIYFSPASYKLIKSDKKKLLTFMTNARKNGFDQVEVTGYTDPTGPAPVNLIISQKRAQVVAEYIQQQSSLDLIAIKGMGAEYPDQDKPGKYHRVAQVQAVIERCGDAVTESSDSEHQVEKKQPMEPASDSKGGKPLEKVAEKQVEPDYQFAIKNSQSLKETLGEWAKEADLDGVVWQLDEKSKGDLSFSVGARFGTEFEPALNKLIQAVNKSPDVHLRADIYQGNDIIVISGFIK